MENQNQDEGSREKLRKLVHEFDTAMLITLGAGHPGRARPMALAKAGMAGDDLQNDQLYFVTDQDSQKVDEISADAQVVVAFQNSKQFISLSGTIEVTQDPALIQKLWSESWRVWFPKGPADPGICILRFEPTEGEYWDNSGMRGLRYLFGAAKAYLTGEQVADQGEETNSRVRL